MRAGLGVLLAAALSLAGCSEPPAQPPDSAVPQRIVAGSPAAVEICCALGLRERLVGRSAFASFPPGIETVASVGGLTDANPEQLVRLKPDLILISGTSQMHQERFGRLGLRLESLPDGGLEDIFTAIHQVGQIVQRQRQAGEVVAGLRSALDAVDQQVPPGSGRRVLLVLQPLANPPEPPTVLGPGSYGHDLLLRAGYRPAMPALTGAYSDPSLEAIARSDPEIIIELVPGSQAADPDERAAHWRLLGDLAAVRAGRVLQLADPKYFVPGPRVAEFYADLRRALAEADER